MQSQLETFHDYLKTFNEHPPLIDRDMLIQLLNARDVSSLSNLDHPTYNALLHSLKSNNDLTRRSARFYIASNLIKHKSNPFVTALTAFLMPHTTEYPPSFVKMVKRINQVDDVEDFTLCCQMISTSPISALYMENLNLYKLSDLAKKRLPQLFSALHELSILHIEGGKFGKYSDEDWKTFCQLISSLPNLSELHFKGSEMAEFDVGRWLFLGEAFASVPTLSKLSLRYPKSFNPNKPQWMAFCQAFSRPTHLASLEITMDLAKTEEFNAWEIFCNTVSRLPQLESLDLTACKLEKLHTSEWQHLSKFSRLPTLSLGLNGLGIAPEGWKALCIALKSLPLLTSLSLPQSYLTFVSHEGWEIFAPVLASLQQVSLAYMIGIDPSANDWKILFQSIQASKLSSLNLCDNRFFLKHMNDTNFDLFCQAIVNAKYLSTLDLSDYTLEEISQERFEKFCNAILAASHLSALDLSYNSLNPDLMPILLETLAKAHHLTSINLMNSFKSIADRWHLFWDYFNKAAHITTLDLSYSCSTIFDGWNVFTEGLSQARHLSSLRIQTDLAVSDDEKILWSALASLFNLVEFKCNHPLPPVIVDLLKRNRLRVQIEKFTQELNSNDYIFEPTQLKQAVAMVTEFVGLLSSLPDTPPRRTLPRRDSAFSK